MYDIRAFFNEQADTWDQNTSYDTDNIRSMLRLSDIPDNAVILDVGCGTGFLEAYLLRHNPSKILAVDFAENMIKVAKSKQRDRRVKFKCADIFDITNNDVTADFCIFYSSFLHFPDQKRLVAHINTLIRQGGRLTICHPPGTKSSTRYKPRISLLPAQGLVNLLKPHYRLDVIVDNNIMCMISGRRLAEK